MVMVMAHSPWMSGEVSLHFLGFFLKTDNSLVITSASSGIWEEKEDWQHHPWVSRVSGKLQPQQITLPHNTHTSFQLVILNKTTTVMGKFLFKLSFQISWVNT